MSSVICSRFLAFLPTSINSKEAANTLSIVASAAKEQGFFIFSTTPFFFACDASAPTEKDQMSRVTVLDVFPGTRASLPTFELGQAKQNWNDDHETISGRVQFYNLMELTKTGFRLESDPLGIKPFYQAEVPGGILLASQIRNLIQIFPDLSKPIDRVGLYGLLMLSSPPSNRTLHEKIRRSQTGACYYWDVQKGLSITRDRRLKAPSVDAAVGTERASGKIFEALKASFQKRIQSVGPQISLALSGGYDSRLLAAIATKLDIRIKAFTYGKNYHREVYTAKLVSKTLGLDHETISYPENNLLLRLPLHLETVEAQSDLGTAQIANMLNIEKQTGAPLMTGFLGETVAGEHLAWLKDEDFDSFEGIADGIVRGYSNRQVFKGQPFIGAELSREAYREEVRKDLREDCYPYQALMIWDLENRQRRYIGAHCELLGSKFHVIAPYYDVDLIEAWFSLPRIPLMKRQFFHFVLARYFPELAKIPHPTEAHPIIPNLKYQILFFLRWNLQRIFSKLPFAKNRETDIDRLWCILTPSQEKYMLSRISELNDANGKIFGIGVSKDLKLMVNGNYQFVRNVFMISEYASWLKVRTLALMSNPRLIEQVAHLNLGTVSL